MQATEQEHKTGDGGGWCLRTIVQLPFVECVDVHGSGLCFTVRLAEPSQHLVNAVTD